MSSNKQNKFLIIGYGNTLRSDDGVGQIVVEKIKTWTSPRVKCISQHQLTPELVEKIAIFPNIIFIDACMNNDDEVRAILLPRFKINNKNEYDGHYCIPEYLLYLTQLIYHKSPKSWLITIPVNNLDLGEKLSELAKKGIPITLKIVKQIINKIE